MPSTASTTVLGAMDGILLFAAILLASAAGALDLVLAAAAWAAAGRNRTAVTSAINSSRMALLITPPRVPIEMTGAGDCGWTDGFFLRDLQPLSLPGNRPSGSEQFRDETLVRRLH